MSKIIEKTSALVVGRIEHVEAAEFRIELFQETPQATALNTGVPTGFPRINSYVLVPNETGAVVAVIKRISINQQDRNKVSRSEPGFIDLPSPSRIVWALPLGTLIREGAANDDGQIYKLERGVPVLPSVGDTVLIPTATQLKSIVEAESDDRIVHIGTAPFAANAKVWVHPDKLFGRHLAILGNTGSGKSCSVAGLIRWSLESAIDCGKKRNTEFKPNTRFIILDPNGEYSDAFKNEDIPVRKYNVGGTNGSKPFSVPGWLWNGQEWAAFTGAREGVQRPILLTALRALRNQGGTAASLIAQMARNYRGYLRQYEQWEADIPSSIAGFPANKNFGDFTEGMCGLADRHVTQLDRTDTQQNNIILKLQDLIVEARAVRNGRLWNNGTGYNDFQPQDVQTVIASLRQLIATFPDGIIEGEIGEDVPISFDVQELPDRISEIAQANGGQALGHVEPLVNRIRVMLNDSRMKKIIQDGETDNLTSWLEAFLGPNGANNEPLAIVDLSLVPSEVIHIAVAVISRIIFEALQRYSKDTGETLPTVLVLEEAHTFVRKDNNTGTSALAAETCRQIFEKISREGRKFGLGLVLASQRPSELSPTVLAQCNSFLLHRIVNDVDQNLVKRLVPDALGGLLSELPSLPSQQAVLLGWAVPTPVLVKMRGLIKEHRPRSHDPKFWDTWLKGEDGWPVWGSVANSWTERPEEPEDEAGGPTAAATGTG